MIIDAFSMLLRLHSTIKKSKIILKEYQILNHLLIFIIETVQNIQQSSIKIIIRYLKKGIQKLF